MHYFLAELDRRKGMQITIRNRPDGKREMIVKDDDWTADGVIRAAIKAELITRDAKKNGEVFFLQLPDDLRPSPRTVLTLPASEDKFRRNCNRRRLGELSRSF